MEEVTALDVETGPDQGGGQFLQELVEEVTASDVETGPDPGGGQFLQELEKEDNNEKMEDNEKSEEATSSDASTLRLSDSPALLLTPTHLSSRKLI